MHQDINYGCAGVMKLFIFFGGRLIVHYLHYLLCVGITLIIRKNESFNYYIEHSQCMTYNVKTVLPQYH